MHGVVVRAMYGGSLRQPPRVPDVVEVSPVMPHTYPVQTLYIMLPYGALWAHFDIIWDSEVVEVSPVQTLYGNKM